MKISYCQHWQHMVWPDAFKDQAVHFLEENASFVSPASRPLCWHQSFALGFFGFHYIRAAKENDFALARESLKIFRGLMKDYHLDGVVLKDLNVHRGARFLDYWNGVIRKVALALGDSLGQEAQQMVELGFWLAAVYAGLVAALKENNHRYMTECLLVLEDGVFSFRPSDMPSPLRNSLIDIKKLLQYSKKRTTAYQCFDEIELMLKHALLLKTAEQWS